MISLPKKFNKLSLHFHSSLPLMTNKVASPKRKSNLIVFDTTLRDGEQSPGVTLNADEKVEIAKQLSRLGVDVCEAGFPIASDGDFLAVERIAKEVGHLMVGREGEGRKPMTICGLARATKGDIQAAYNAIKSAPFHRIHTFLATSDIHLVHKLKISREECIKRAVEAVTFARERDGKGEVEVEFSCEDAARSDREFLVEVLNAVVEAGASTLNIPDTVGYNTPQEFGDLMAYLVERVKSSHPIVFSTHCHNDLGLATANTLAGVSNGARQVEVTINGIGERAGNTSLEEVVMAIHTHPSTFPVSVKNITTNQIYNTSRLVTRKTGMPIQPNKAIVGANAFAHESGIHQDGMLKNPTTYEIIDPKILGLPSKALVLGKHSGRNAFRVHIDELVKNTVYQASLAADATLYNTLFIAFKKLADARKTGVTDEDLFALLDDIVLTNGVGGPQNNFTFNKLSIMSATGMLSTATVSIIFNAEEENGREVVDAATGHGPIDAIFNVINRIVGFKNVLASFEVKAVSEGSDAPGHVVVKIKQDDAAEEEAKGEEEEAAVTSPKAGSPTKRKGKTDTSAASVRSKRLRVDSTDEGAGVFSASAKGVFVGQGMDEDILVASAKAYLNAINRLIINERRFTLADQSSRNVNV